jgi:hypothetical protein
MTPVSLGLACCDRRRRGASRSDKPVKGDLSLELMDLARVPEQIRDVVIEFIPKEFWRLLWKTLLTKSLFP